MKKFISFSPQQIPANLKQYVYEPVDNPKLKYGETSFPIIPVINGYLDQDDEFQVITIVADYENTVANYEKLKQEVKNVCSQKNIAIKQDSMIEIPMKFDDSVGNLLKMFHDLIDHIEENDELYACITYGSKPAEIIELMALRYARKLKKNTYIGCVAYGQMNFIEKKARIYDETSIIRLDDIVQTVSEMEIDNPAQFIKELL